MHQHDKAADSGLYLAAEINWRWEESNPEVSFWCTTSYNAPAEVIMPYYIQHMQDIMDELGIPDVKAYRIRLDDYVQQILGTRDLEPEQVWAILQPKLKDASWRAQFVEQLRAKWEKRNWREEGI